MEERITNGLSINRTYTGTPAEIVTLDMVKDFLNMPYSPGESGYFPLHDIKLTRLQKSCREAIEGFCNVSLFPCTVTATWVQLFDFEPLPYCGLANTISTVTVKDLSDNTYDVSLYKIVGNRIYADFIDGVKITYTVAVGTIPTTVEQVILACIYDVFINKMSITDAVVKNALILK